MAFGEAAELQLRRNTYSPVYIKPAHPIPDIVTDVRSGLFSRPRMLPPKYFYDDRGSELFEKITETDEYYPTRTEDRLLSEYGQDIIRISRPDQIIELGSGSSRKTRRLFDACETLNHLCEYAPFDVCAAALNQAAWKLNSEYEWLDITPMVGDYHAGLDNLPEASGKRLFVFLGSTIGNFLPQQASDFISHIRACMLPGDYFLIGADRVKDPGVLNAAYNDAEGITAEFNLNVLNVLNRELDSNFNTDYFSHSASYNEDLGRIEMYLRSDRQQTVTVNKMGTTLDLDRGEQILTELSYKFSAEELQKLLIQSGLTPVRHYQPANRYFSLLLSVCPG